jgi:hypothetical protein
MELSGKQLAGAAVTSAAFATWAWPAWQVLETASRFQAGLAFIVMIAAGMWTILSFRRTNSAGAAVQSQEKKQDTEERAQLVRDVALVLENCGIRLRTAEVAIGRAHTEDSVTLAALRRIVATVEKQCGKECAALLKAQNEKPEGALSAGE